MIDSLSKAAHAFARCILTSLPVDATLLLRYLNLPTDFGEPQLRVEIASS